MRLWCVGAWPALHAVLRRAQPGSPGARDPRLPHGPACIPCACLWPGRECPLPLECGCHTRAVDVETAAGHDRGCGMCPGAGQGWTHETQLMPLGHQSCGWVVWQLRQMRWLTVAQMYPSLCGKHLIALTSGGKTYSHLTCSAYSFSLNFRSSIRASQPVAGFPVAGRVFMVK